MLTVASSMSTDHVARRRPTTAATAHIAASILVCASLGCSSHSVRSTTRTTITAQPPPPRTEGISLPAPTVGLFIGVSDYGERATVYSTPAHTLSAALMYEPFFNAAAGSETALRKEALGIPADNYDKPHARSACGVAFSPDGSLYATASEDGAVVFHRNPNRSGMLRSTRADGRRSSCAWSSGPTGSTVALGEDGGVTIWSPRTWRVAACLLA